MAYDGHLVQIVHSGPAEMPVGNGETGRLVLFSTKAATPYLDHIYRDDDILLFGRESAGVPDDVVNAADERLVIPIAPGMRSLNVAMTVAMALGEALRQTRAVFSSAKGTAS